MDQVTVKTAPCPAVARYCCSLLLLLVLLSIVSVAQVDGERSNSSIGALNGQCGSWIVKKEIIDPPADNGFQCGRRRSYASKKHATTRRDRTLGGEKMRMTSAYIGYDGEFPSYLALSTEQDGEIVFCSGTLISADLVMTASSCIQDDTKWMTAQVIKNGTNGGEARDPQERYALGYCRMTGYPSNWAEGEGALNDVAILRMDKPFELKPSAVEPACLKLDQSHKDEAQCYAVGEGPWSKPLWEPMKRTRCAEGAKMATSISCYKSTVKQGGNTCSYDRGGPMYCLNKCGGLNQQVVVGVLGAPPAGNEECRWGDAVPNGYTDLYKVRKELMAVIESCSKKVEVTLEKPPTASRGGRRFDGDKKPPPSTKIDFGTIDASWAPVMKDPVGSGVLLFKKLFTKYPQYIKLFPAFSDLDLEHMQENKFLVKHVTKVIDAIDTVVLLIGGPQEAKLQEVLVGLVKSHVKRKVGLTEFQNLGGVLIEFLSDVNKDQPEPLDQAHLTTAWQKIYAVILNIVKREAGETSGLCAN